MTSIDTLTIPFFALVLLGYLCGRVTRLPEEGLAWLNLFVLYVAVPAMFFAVVSRTPIGEFREWPFAVVTTAVTLCTLGLALGYAYLTNGRDFPRAVIAMTAGGYSNGGYIGVPLTLTAFGPAAGVPTALIFICDSTLIFTLVPLLMAVSGADRSAGFGAILGGVGRRVLLHPFNIATALAILVAALGMRFPAPVEKTIDLLTAAAAPCALFALGVTVALRPLGRMGATLPGALVIKLLLHPLAMLAVMVTFTSYPPVWIGVAVLMASLSPALGVYVLARQYNVWVKEASNAILIGTFVSLFTVSLLLHAMQAGWLPIGALSGQ